MVGRYALVRNWGPTGPQETRAAAPLVTGPAGPELLGAPLDLTATGPSAPEVATRAGSWMFNTPTNPTAGAGATALMMGLAGVMVTSSTGNALLTVNGTCSNGISGDGVTIQLRISAAPGQPPPPRGQGATGTALGNPVTFQVTSQQVRLAPFVVSGIALGLIQGASYWVDVSIVAVGGGTGTISSITMTGVEV